jgi:16S rRNA (uracil1498-N3)-methyltransferase
MQLFYTKNINGNFAQLEEEEARHAVQVLRKKVGDTMQLTDGMGVIYEGIIAEIGKKICTVSIQSKQEAYNNRPYKIHMAIAPTKNIDRLEWFLEKATEIGIDEITPLICTRSERTVVKIERLSGIILSAMKQSLKTYLPKLHEAIDFQKFIQQDFLNYHQKFIAHCYSISDFGFGISESAGVNFEIRKPQSELEKTPLSKIHQKGKNAVVLIGPEGDFTEGEVETAMRIGFQGISLGESRLRTETAGVVACHTINLLNEM